jgi:hypothetical protein
VISYYDKVKIVIICKACERKILQNWGTYMSMRKIYREIAKKNGVTINEVKRETQSAINEAYQNPPDNGVTRAYQNRIPRKGAAPTAEAFIRYAAGEAKRRTE